MLPDDKVMKLMGSMARDGFATVADKLKKDAYDWQKVPYVKLWLEDQRVKASTRPKPVTVPPVVKTNNVSLKLAKKAPKKVAKKSKKAAKK